MVFEKVEALCEKKESQFIGLRKIWDYLRLRFVNGENLCHRQKL